MHDPHCQCPHCDVEMARVYMMRPNAYARWLQETQDQLMEEGRIRHATHYTGEQPMDNLAPDPYEPHLQKLRVAAGLDPHADAVNVAEQLRSMTAFRDSVFAMQATALIAAESPATSRIYVEPPDPYEPHLERLRKERR